MKILCMVLFDGLFFTTGSLRAAGEANPPVLQVTLLGTGSVSPKADRSGPATLVEAGPEKLLFDCGRGCLTRLAQHGISPRNLKLFITHHHSDHVTGIPDLWLMTMGAAFMVFGPEGTKNMMDHIKLAYQEDIRLRESVFPPFTYKARDITPGVVYEQSGIRVTAFDVDHGRGLSYGYRVDYQGRSIVLSGDTTFSRNIVEHSRNVDVLVHEVMMATPHILEKSPLAKHVLKIHTTPQQAGTVFAEAQPRLAVYTHIKAMAGPDEKTLQPVDFIRATRETYSGPVAVGEDLMVINIGKTITVQRP